MNRYTLSRYTLILAATVLMAACGGGGGGGTAPASDTPSAPALTPTPVPTPTPDPTPVPTPEPTPPPVPTPTPVPTPPPEPVVTYLNLTTATYSDYGVLFNRALATEATDIRAAYHQPSTDPLRLAEMLWLRPEAAAQIKNTLLAAMPTTSGTHVCSQGGSMTRTLNDGNGDGKISIAGESQQLVFSNCSNGTVTANGSTSYRVTAASPTLGVEVSYSGLTVVRQGTTYSASGQKTITLYTVGGLDLTSTTVTAFTTTAQSSTSTTATTLQIGHSSRYTETGTQWSIRTAGSLQLKIGNDIANLMLTQSIPFSGDFSGAAYQPPATGSYELLWNGAQRLTTTSSTAGLLTIVFDSDNNGTVEATFTRNWGTLTIPD